MKEIIRNVIERGTYDLSGMLKKIDTLWVQESITDAEREELVSLARGNADVQHSIDVMRKLMEFDMRLKEAEDAIKKLRGEAPEGGDDESGEVTYPEYVPGKIYYNGDKITFVDGKNYKCIAPHGAVCVWSPSEYPAYWEVNA